MSELFRKEVTAHQASQLAGEVLVGARPPWLWLGYILCGLVIVAFVGACFGTYSRKEEVTGWIVPQGGIARLAARNDSTIKEIPVAEGQKVHAGQTLIRLQTSLNISGGDVGTMLEGSVRNEIAVSRAGAQSQVEKIEADKGRLILQRNNYLAQKSEGEQALRLLEQKAELSKDNLSRLENLYEKNYVSRQALDTGRSAYIDLQQSVSSQKSALLAIQQNIDELTSQLAQLPIAMQQARAQAEASAVTLNQKLLELQSSSEAAIQAPFDSVVMAIPGYPGQSVSQGQTVVVLMPDNSRLEVELFVPSRAIGFIAPGQSVSLQYQSFSYKKFGSGHGRILEISKTPLTPAEVALTGMMVAEPVYRVRASLEQNYVNAYGRQVPLKPGMALNADVVIERRTIVEWLLDPLYAVGKR